MLKILINLPDWDILFSSLVFIWASYSREIAFAKSGPIFETTVGRFARKFSIRVPLQQQFLIFFTIIN